MNWDIHADRSQVVDGRTHPVKQLPEASGRELSLVESRTGHFHRACSSLGLKSRTQKAKV